MLLLLKSVSNWQPFPKIGNNRNTMHQVIDRKSFQWLGATVATGRDSDMIVVSAFVFIMYTIGMTEYRCYIVLYLKLAQIMGFCFIHR